MAVVPLGAIPWVEMVVGSQEEASKKKKRNLYLCPKQNILWTNHRLSLNPAASHFKKERMLICQNITFLKSYFSVQLSV